MRILSLICMVAALWMAGGGASAASVTVSTYHYDIFRSGWNQAETSLTPALVGNTVSGQALFGQLWSISLDEQVDAQPLVVPNAVIDGDPNAGSHDVAFVVTEANTVYAIDPTRGTVLNQVNLGAAVPTPLGCTNNSASVGINGTPVIDPSTDSLYVVAYTQGTGGPVYTLHRLALHNFSDIVPPVVISASVALVGGSPDTFNATYQRQRAALLLSNGSVFVAFGSFCDFSASVSRGWLLGYQAATLAPLPFNNQAGTVELLTNRLATSPDSFFLSSIWMSGYGPASHENGHIFFVTGNSDYSGTTYNGRTNIQESVVNFNPANNRVTSLFTPSSVGALDQNDEDFGSGGVMLVPESLGGPTPMVAVAAGKSGIMYVLRTGALGGYTPGGPDNVLASATVGGCWCGPSFYSDGQPHIVIGGGQTISSFLLAGKPQVSISPVGSVSLPNGQDGGMMTSVSSNGKADAIIWAVTRPVGGSTNLELAAVNPVPVAGSLPLLFTQPAGTWPNLGGNADIVPVVANGLVYVGSYKALTIFGLGAP